MTGGESADVVRCDGCGQAKEITRTVRVGRGTGHSESYFYCEICEWRAEDQE